MDTEGATFRVVVNGEEQYSIWWSDREIPSGWRDVGVEGTKEQCLHHVGEVWTDMRPLSLRREEAAGGPGDPARTS